MNLSVEPGVILAALLLGGGGFATGWLVRSRARGPRSGAVAPCAPAAGNRPPEPAAAATATAAPAAAVPAAAVPTAAVPAAAAPTAAVPTAAVPTTAVPTTAASAPVTARPIDAGALVAGLAHEVRNPLFGISATLDAFEARFGQVPEHQPYTIVLRGELTRITLLIEKLLEYGRPTPPVFADASLDEALSLALDLVEPVVRARTVTIRRADRGAGDPLVLPALRMDREHVARALSQLLENAAQFSPDGGEVLVRITRPGGTDVRIDVLDAGPGLPDVDSAQMLEPFFSRRRGGAGLGLAIARRIAEEHGGTLSVTNRTEGGTCQSLWLPLPCASGHPPDTSDQTPPETSTRHFQSIPGAARGGPRRRVNDGA